MNTYRNPNMLLGISKSTGKDEILTCIVNSYLDTYNCEKLKLTENGQALDTGDTELDGYMNHF